MTLDEYQTAARRTAEGRDEAAYPQELREIARTLRRFGHEKQANALFAQAVRSVWALGLAGEAGEVCDLLKKSTGHGKPLDIEKLQKELGDVLWYVAMVADWHGISLDAVAQGNVDKLLARHPAGFTVSSANAKADEVAGNADE